MPPLPDSESGLSETESEVTKEGEEAIYKCSEPDYLVMGAKPEFKLACGSDGFFPMLAEWPECVDPEVTTTTTTTEKPPDPCQCIGKKHALKKYDQFVLNTLLHQLCKKLVKETIFNIWRHEKYFLVLLIYQLFGYYFGKIQLKTL